MLDTAAGDVTVKAVVDAAAPGTTPEDGVDTGGGWAAVHGDDTTNTAGIAGGIAAALALGVAVSVVIRRRSLSAAAPAVSASASRTEGNEAR